jgi:tetratricopeptide (TPR) repeat protein
MGDVQGNDRELEEKRAILRTKPDDLAAWVAIGNRHLLQGETDLAEIFYLHAAEKNSKYVPAINNLAYLKGREGDLNRANAGFRAALAQDEFAVVPKKNVARLQMASGLWRHASLNYRQLEVRAPADAEVRRGVALAALAGGNAQVDARLIRQGEGDNGRFAEAVHALARGDRNRAASLLGGMAASNEYAKLILDFWNTKESK